MKVKRNSKIFITSILIMTFFITGCSKSKDISTNSNSKPIIGAVIGSFDDTWRTSLRNELYEMAKDKAEMNIWSADNSQETENKKIDALIDSKVNVLVINLIEKSAAPTIIAKAQKANIPVIFFNIQPSEEDLKIWDKVYYVGSKGEQSGMIQGQILADYFKNNPTKDGVVHYVMLKGPDGHPDADSRSIHSVDAMKDAGLNVEKLSDAVASWDREKAKNEMRNFIATEGDKIDCVIANDDDMALGAIDALKEKGYFTDGKYMPVVGVDGNNSTISFLKQGTLLATVLNDASEQGKAIFNLASVLSSGQTPTKDNVNYAIDDHRCIWIDYKKITKENISDIK
ncbi:galactose ABC transporter substrate-binding protein [Clostridium chromiireducens]|uniref:galactose ABC transporter substrate-binding protein n=1 Tax=Clostridium chromiireducens TaxID=225345 RepID=UPI003AF9CA81